MGDFAERVAVATLHEEGLEIVGRNVRVRSGEIDIVCRDGADIVFVEVRSRRAAPGAAGESLTDDKLERMWRCALDYCEAEGLPPETLRLDAVVLDLDAGGRVEGVHHFRALELSPE
jgi:putative endonuclease